jgi:hypothetical protein
MHNLVSRWDGSDLSLVGDPVSEHSSSSALNRTVSVDVYVPSKQGASTARHKARRDHLSVYVLWIAKRCLLATAMVADDITLRYSCDGSLVALRLLGYRGKASASALAIHKTFYQSLAATGGS